MEQGSPDHQVEEGEAESPPRHALPERQSSSVDEIAALYAKRAGLSASFRFALDGVFRTLNSQRNMKIHWVSGLAVMLVGMALELDIASRASVMFCVGVVLGMEILNTAFEAFVDLHVKQYAKHAMIAKDGAAAAVLVMATMAVVVFSDVLFHRWRMILQSGPAIIRTVACGIPALALTGTILGAKRSMPLFLVLGATAIGLVGYLAWFSRDEVFTLGSVGFILGALFARYREPALLD